MTEEQKAAYVYAQSTCALISAMGMVAENMQRETLGHSMAYVAEDFDKLIVEWGIHHNGVFTIFHG